MALTLAGLLLLRAGTRLDAGRWATGRAASVVRVLPVLTASVVLLVGALVVLRSLLTLHTLGRPAKPAAACRLLP